MSKAGGQSIKCRIKISENFNRLSSVTDRRQTDGRATANSEREREFTFTKNTLETGSVRTSDD